jgi:redox-sensing transcriptional repressor
MEETMNAKITIRMLQRLPLYLSYLKDLTGNGAVHISATAIADALGLNDVQVRKDLAAISEGGKPKIGYEAEPLIRRLEKVLGYDDRIDAVLAGVGNLGHALMAYQGFSEYGLNIAAGFDVDEKVIGSAINGKMIYCVKMLDDMCRSNNIQIGILTVPAKEAQSVCDAFVASGIKSIWNFAPIRLKVPAGVIVQNETMAASLAILSRHCAKDRCL